MNLTTMDPKPLIAVLSALGALLTLITQRILNKRGLLTYQVVHTRVGVSADDAVFGSIRLTWNNNQVANLYSSAVELTNRSLKDYERVVVRVFTNDTSLLTERTEILGTTRVLSWTDEFSTQVHVAPGQQPTQAQRDLVWRQRDYLVETLNRGQVVRMHFLNAAKTQNQPTIWLDVLHPGTKLRFRVQQNQILGVPQPVAAVIGAIVGFALLGVLIAFVNSVWLVGLFALLYGFFAQLPGAILVRTWRTCRQWLGD